VGERIRHLRHERHLSQEALAELAGLDRQTVGAYERAQTSGSLDEVVAIAAALSVDTWRLFYG
jgi:transcriptional regulator with XRE-family HTH domain